jgi:hypothetical protein
MVPEILRGQGERRARAPRGVALEDLPDDAQLPLDRALSALELAADLGARAKKTERL